MSQLIVRNIEDDVKIRLERRAMRNGRSVEEEVREILRAAVNDEGHSSAGLGSRIAARFAGQGLTQPLPELPK
jgi:plasmid stability protein